MRVDSERATEFYSKYYRENPKASIHDAMKAADKEGIPILKEIASRCRQKVLDTQKKPEVDWKVLESEDVPPVGKVFTAPESWSQPKPTPPPAEPPQELLPEDVAEIDAKKALVNKLLDEDPSSHPTIIQAELLKKFGKGIDPRYIYDCARIARDQNGLEQIPYRSDINGRAPPEPRADPVMGAVRSFVETLKSSGIRPESFILSINKEWEVEFTYDRLVSSSGKMKL